MDFGRAASSQNEVLERNFNREAAFDEKDLLSRKIEIVYGYIPSGLLATVFASMATALFLAREGYPLTAACWAGGMALVAALRLANFIAYRRSANERSDPARWWRRLSPSSPSHSHRT